MIYEKSCIVCGQKVRANGEYAFNSAVREHYEKQHPMQYEKLLDKLSRCKTKIHTLMGRFPECRIGMGRILLNQDYLVTKTNQ